MIQYRTENRRLNQYNETSGKIEVYIQALHFFSHSAFSFYLFWLSLKITGSMVVTCGYFQVPSECFIKELMNNQRLISSTQWGFGWWERFRLRPCSDEVGHHLLVTWWYISDILCCLGVHSQCSHVVRSASFYLLQPETCSKGDWY